MTGCACLAGGVPEGVAASLWALHQELQPDAVAFQGPDVGTQPNLIRWAGTEGGHVKYPFWSAANTLGVNASAKPGQGDPNGKVFAPGEADTCFQVPYCQTPHALARRMEFYVLMCFSMYSRICVLCTHVFLYTYMQGGSLAPESDAATDAPVSASGPYGGCWFYNKGMHPKSLQELVSSYHDTVGKNAFWLLDWTPNQATYCQTPYTFCALYGVLCTNVLVLGVRTNTCRRVSCARITSHGMRSSGTG